MSGGRFWRQTSALIRKNWIVLLRHPWVNGIRCLVFPIGYGIILAMLPEMVFGSEADSERETIVKSLSGGLGLAFSICYLPIVYHIAGALASERADLTTEYLKAMGAIDFARLLSWHISLSLAHLPSWIIVSLIWKFRIFQNTNAGLILLVHILYGLSLASWSLFVAVPFRKNPYLPAVVAVAVAVGLNVVPIAGIKHPSNGGAFVFSLVFPAAAYVYACRPLAWFDGRGMGTPIGTNPGEKDPVALIVPIVASFVSIFLWPLLALLLEKYLYTAKNPGSSIFRRRQHKLGAAEPLPPHLALSVKHVNKEFTAGVFKKKTTEVIEDLTLDVPKHGIYVLLGSNGAGKSTFLSILACLIPRTSGSVTFSNGRDTADPGSLGVVPQKNVLFNELTCLENIQVWSRVKYSGVNTAAEGRGNGNAAVESEEELIQLLRDCDLETKIHSQAGTLSGGQKRKLQLAIGLVGGSQFVLVDECTSGVDALSRRAIWKTLTAFREERTILLTTHFLDEADLLADNIAILAAPGKLIAEGTPVALKRQYGEGYSLQVTLTKAPSDSQPHSDHTSQSDALLRHIRTHAPEAYMGQTDLTSQRLTYRLKTKDNQVVGLVLEAVEAGKHQHELGVESYDVLGPSIEDVFLRLMTENDKKVDEEMVAHHHHHHDRESTDTGPATSSQRGLTHKPGFPHAHGQHAPLQLSNGTQTSALSQTLVIFHKRLFIARTSYITPLLMLAIAIVGGVVVLALAQPTIYTFLGPDGELIIQRPDFLRQSCFTKRDYRDSPFGGSSDWPPAGYDPGLSIPPNDALMWQLVFGAVMALCSAFPALYVTRERRVSSVQAMQFSNGLTHPIALWCGHLLFDMIVPVIAMTVLVIVAATKHEFVALGTFWFICVLFWVPAIFFAYMGSLIASTPIVAFAAVALYQLIVYAAYTIGHFVSVSSSYDTSTQKTGILITHFILAVISPLASLMRASFVTLNSYGILCRGPLDDQHMDGSLSASGTGSFLAYGAPIMFLLLAPWVYLYILIRADSGTVPFLGRLRRNRSRKTTPHQHAVDKAAFTPNKADGGEWHQMSSASVAGDTLEGGAGNEILQVQGISKTFKERKTKKKKNKVVDDISMNIDHDTIYALLGPNGAGKTTTFNIIRGDLLPDEGDVLIGGTSIISDPMRARTGLGVCPQFTAIDAVLTVREHLEIYGRLKGLSHKISKGTSGEAGCSELDRNVEMLIDAMGLAEYKDRQASKLSGGNQRKLSLAMAVIGNPRMILIDEFSTGVDAKMKRELWVIVRTIAQGKAVIITTHSMEEASALANRVGIIARRMLATGTPKTLTDQYAKYQVHFSCRTREDMIKAREFMATNVPGCKLADDVATRFEVPLQDDSGNGLTLPGLFRLLSERYSSGDEEKEWTVEQPSLETVFLKVIKENDVRELEENRRKERGGRGR